MEQGFPATTLVPVMASGVQGRAVIPGRSQGPFGHTCQGRSMVTLRTPPLPGIPHRMSVPVTPQPDRKMVHEPPHLVLSARSGVSGDAGLDPNRESPMDKAAIRVN